MKEPYMLYGRSKDEPCEYRYSDTEAIKCMYPDSVRAIQEEVSRVCDGMEYEFSPMYDECPDQIVIQQLCDRICSKMLKKQEEKEKITPKEVNEVEIYEARRPGGAPPRRPWGPPPPGPGRPWGSPPPPPGSVRPPWLPPQRPGRPPLDPWWMNDVVRILLGNEMYCRRCRR